MDLISRQAALDALMEAFCDTMIESICKDTIEALPSAQPEIVRCKDCKYSDENLRRVSVKWLPCMDVRTGGNWFCGSAERREE